MIFITKMNLCALLCQNKVTKPKYPRNIKLQGLFCRMVRRLGSLGGGRRIVVARNSIDCGGMSIGRGG